MFPYGNTVRPMRSTKMLDSIEVTPAQALLAACKEAREAIVREHPHYKGLIERLDRAIAGAAEPARVLTWEHNSTRCWDLRCDARRTNIRVLLDAGVYHVGAGAVVRPGTYTDLEMAQKAAEKHWVKVHA